MKDLFSDLYTVVPN